MTWRKKSLIAKDLRCCLILHIATLYLYIYMIYTCWHMKPNHHPCIVNVKCYSDGVCLCFCPVACIIMIVLCCTRVCKTGLQSYPTFPFHTEALSDLPISHFAAEGYEQFDQVSLGATCPENNRVAVRCWANGGLTFLMLVTHWTNVG